MSAPTEMTPADVGIAASRRETFEAMLVSPPTGKESPNVIVESNGKRYAVCVRANNEMHGKKARVYVHGAMDSASPSVALGGFAEAIGAPGPFTERGAFPALDKAWDAFNGWIVEQKTAALSAVMLELLDWRGMREHVKFSRKAGCACGCSPGFIVDSGLPANRDVWVEELPAPAPVCLNCNTVHPFPQSACPLPTPKMSVKALGAFVLGLLEQQRAGHLSEHAFTAAVRAAKNGEPLAERFAAIALRPLRAPKAVRHER